MAFSAYSASDIVNVSGKTSSGNRLSVPVETKWSTLSPIENLMIFQRCAPVFGIVSSRANKASGIEWHVVPIKNEIDKIYNDLKTKRAIFQELSPTLSTLPQRIKLYNSIRTYVKDIKTDLSNFETASYRWYKEVKQVQTDKCNEIEDFFSHPAKGILWTDFIKMIVTDLHIHGRVAIYKQKENNRVSSLFVLPGGSVIPIHGKQVGESLGYVQMIGGYNDAQIFFNDEIAFGRYMANSSTTYGMSPLDALINLVSENLLFNELMAGKADGSTPPEKMVVFGERQPGIEEEGFFDPIDKEEQVRIEKKINRIKKENGIATLTGVGTPIVLDLSRADTIPTQMLRQDQINKYVAIVFNASNQEINETGGNGTSGRSTSETQERNDNSKGLRPVLKIIEEIFTREIIPYRYGFGYKMEFDEPRSEEQKAEFAKLKKDSGIFSVNEIRVSDFGLDPVSDPTFDVPSGATPQQQGNELLEQIQNNLK